MKPSGKEFKEAKLSNCFSADSLPVESAQCLRLRDLQTELKISTKPLLKSYCALSSGKESAEKHYSTWLLLKSLLARFQMLAFYENIRFSSGMSSHRTLACTWILLAHWTVFQTKWILKFFIVNEKFRRRRLFENVSCSEI